MQFSYNLTSQSFTADTSAEYPDYGGVQVSRRVSASGVHLCVSFSAASQTALRPCLADGLLSLIGEMDKCKVPRAALSDAVIGVVASGSGVATILVDSVSGRPFVVDGGILDAAGSVFEAASRMDRDSRKPVAGAGKLEV